MLDLDKLCKVAIEAAKAAGEIIQKYVNTDLEVEKKEGGAGRASQVVTKVDRACEEIIVRHLAPSCKEWDLALLTEETVDNGERLQKDFFWCVDPLDGTLPFINKKSGFSVSIALVAQDGTPQLGVVFDPSYDRLYYAIKGKGAFKNSEAFKVENRNAHLTYVSDKKLSDTPNADKIEKLLSEHILQLGLEKFEEISGGGAVMNAIRVLENGPALMLKLPKEEKCGGSLWDFAATACIFSELDLPATNFMGAKLDLNRKESTFMNHEGVMYCNLG